MLVREARTYRECAHGCIQGFVYPRMISQQTNADCHYGVDKYKSRRMGRKTYTNSDQVKRSYRKIGMLATLLMTILGVSTKPIAGIEEGDAVLIDLAKTQARE